MAGSFSTTFSMIFASLIQTFPETPDRPGEDGNADDGQRDVLGPEDVQPHSLEKDSADDDEKIAQRVEICQPLNELGHVRDRKNEAGEHKEGEDEEEGGHHRLLSRLRHHRDEQPDAQGAQQKEAGCEEEGEDAPRQRNLEPVQREQHDEDHLADRDDRIGDGLADDELERLERRHDELLHRPRLPFLDDCNRGQEQRDQHDDEGDDPRDEEVLAVEVRIVPGPDPGVDLPVLEVAAVKFAEQLLVQPVEDHHCVGDPDGGHVAHAAVGEDLDGGRLSPADPAAEIGRNLDSEVGLPGKEELLHPAGIGQPVGDPEDPARGEGVGQKPALPGLRLVDQRDTDVFDIVVDHVAEDKKLDERRHHQDDAVLPVAEELDEFLADHFPDSEPAHSPSRFRMMTFSAARIANIPVRTKRSGQRWANPRSRR